MGILDRAELLLQAKNYSGTGDWLDESGNGHDAQFGSTSGADTNDPEVLAHDGSDYVRLPGVAGNYASMPDVNLLDADTAHNVQGRGDFWSRADMTVAEPTVAPISGVFADACLYTKVDVGGEVGVGYIAMISSGGALVDPSTQYSISVKVYTEVEGYQVQVLGGWRDAAHSSAGDLVGTWTDIVPGVWTELSVTGVSPATAAYCATRYQISKSGDKVVGDEFWFAEHFLGEGADPTFVPSLRIVGDLELRAKVAADYSSLSRSGIIENYNTAGYRLEFFNTTSLLLATNSSDYLIAAHGLSDGDAAEIRGTVDVSTGDFEVFVDGSSVASVTKTAGPLNPSADLFVGSWTSTVFLFDGDIYWAEVRDGIDGPVVSSFRASDFSEPFDTATDEVGNEWTINRSGSGLYVVDRPAFGFHTDDYFEVADHADLDFAAAEALSVIAIIRSATIGATNAVLVGKKDNLTTSAGWMLYRATAAGTLLIGDGAADDTDTASSLVAYTQAAVAGVRNIVDDDIETFLDGTGSGSPTTDSTTATLANALPLRIGATSNVAASFFDGEIMAVALFREALTDEEIAIAGSLLTGSSDLYVLHGDALQSWLTEWTSATSGEVVGMLNELNGTAGIEYSEARRTFMGL